MSYSGQVYSGKIGRLYPESSNKRYLFQIKDMPKGLDYFSIPFAFLGADLNLTTNLLLQSASSGWKVNVRTADKPDVDKVQEVLYIYVDL